MASSEEVREIELRRLKELEIQRAYGGIGTEPSVLLEISDLRAKYGTAATAVSREAGPDLGHASVKDLLDEIDFIRAICASALRRITEVEQQRAQDVFWRNVWLVSLTIAVVFVLIRLY